MAKVRQLVDDAAQAIIAAVYLRKSNDEGDKAAEVKSIAVQKALAVEFAAKHGWTLDDRFIFQDDGISGAEFVKRPGLSALLSALEPKPVFKALIVAEQSRLGRETLDTLLVVRQIERAGVEIWSTNDGRQITLANDAGEIMAMLDSWRDTSERRKTITRVRNASFNRHENGFVPGGKTYGYANERLPGTGKQPVRRVIDETEAAVVRRIFDERAAGLGLQLVANRLNAEGVRAPQQFSDSVIAKRLAAGESVPSGKWSSTSVREILNRELYKGEVVHGKVRKTRLKGKPVRERVPESDWKRRHAPELRIVTDDQWQAAHAAGAASSKKYLRDGQKFIGRAENLTGKFLLSGLLACGAPLPEGVTRAHGGSVCGEKLIGLKRGRKEIPSYACGGRRKFGEGYCANDTAVPMVELHGAVINALRATFSPEKLVEHLQSKANDADARAERQAERAALLARIPALAKEEERLVDMVASGLGSEAMAAGVKARQQERLQAEARVAELEGIERDLRADGAALARLQASLPDWFAALDAEPVLARQVLRKVLGGPILVWSRPEERRRWHFVGIGRVDGLLSGIVKRGSAITVHYGSLEQAQVIADLLRPALAELKDTPDDAERLRHAMDSVETDVVVNTRRPAPIAGGSDAELDAPHRGTVGQDPEGPPMPPARSAPAEPWHSSMSAS